jgi:hypothetical protein
MSPLKPSYRGKLNLEIFEGNLLAPITKSRAPDFTAA